MGRERIERVFHKTLKQPEKPLGKIMVEEGYDETTAKKPMNMKKTKTWQELMDSYIPDTLVAKTHKELFSAAMLDHFVFPVNMDDKLIKATIESIKGCKLQKIVHGEKAKHAYYWIPNTKARKDAVDLAYKIRGRFAPTEIKVSPLQKLSDEELAAIAAGEAELEDE